MHFPWTLSCDLMLSVLHQVYTISVSDKEKSWLCRRTFDEFCNLHSDICAYSTSSFVPPAFPHRHWFFSFFGEEEEQRRWHLEVYLNELLKQVLPLTHILVRPYVMTIKLPSHSAFCSLAATLLCTLYSLNFCPHKFVLYWLVVVMHTCQVDLFPSPPRTHSSRATALSSLLLTSQSPFGFLCLSSPPLPPLFLNTLLSSPYSTSFPNALYISPLASGTAGTQRDRTRHSHLGQ